MLEAGRRSVTLAEMTSARGRALPAACEGAEVGTVSLTPVNSAHGRFDRRQSSVRPRQLLPPASLLLPPAPSTTRLSLLLSLSVLHQNLRCCTHGMLQAPVCRAHTHA